MPHIDNLFIDTSDRTSDTDEQKYKRRLAKLKKAAEKRKRKNEKRREALATVLESRETN
jgi:hypothetical protein